jgi:hypothetical protein
MHFLLKQNNPKTTLEGVEAAIYETTLPFHKSNNGRPRSLSWYKLPYYSIDTCIKMASLKGGNFYDSTNCARNIKFFIASHF